MVRLGGMYRESNPELLDRKRPGDVDGLASEAGAVSGASGLESHTAPPLVVDKAIISGLNFIPVGIDASVCAARLAEIRLVIAMSCTTVESQLIVAPPPISTEV